MSHTLTKRELELLNILYRSRSLASNRGYHSGKLRRIITRNMGLDKNEFDDLIQGLLNKGLITTIGKSPVKYYISDPGAAIKVLIDHGYTTVTGTRKL